jgi:predicted Zn-dependent peptidase
MDVLGGIMWPDSALGRPLTGTETTVKSISRKKMIDFKNKHYHAGNIVVIGAGNVDSGRLRKYISEKFSGLKRKKSTAREKISFSQNSLKLKVLKGTTSQAHFAVGCRASAGSMKKRYAIKVMNVILGGNMSSRLFENLRENQGLCYDIGSSYKRHADLGELHIHSGVDNSKVVRSLSGVVDELSVLKNNVVPGEELKRAKEFIKGQFLLAMEGTSTRMLWMGDRLLVHKKIPQLKSVLDRIDAVTAKEIMSAAREIFNPENVNMALIGDVKEVEKKKIKKELRRI